MAVTRRAKTGLFKVLQQPLPPLLPLLGLLLFALLPHAAAHLHEAHLESFDACEATIESVHHALQSATASCREIVSAFIARVERLNPTINAIITLNPDALQIADTLDDRLRAANVTGKLFCIPVLLKDSFDATPMPTTGGSLALANKVPPSDGPAVKALRDAGAVILGKTNLHEMALEGISVSSLGGQTINPYDHTRTPGGSSGGTGAALAASFAVLGTGTDTMNSLRSPASANNLVSVRPTRGLLSRSGVIPVSRTQDTIGPMARTIDDLAVALTIMAGVGQDPLDKDTMSVAVAQRCGDYSAHLRGGSLSGLRIGALEGFWNRTASTETTPVNDAMERMVRYLEAQGVQIINITDPAYNAVRIGSALDVQRYEYRQLLDEYLANPDLNGVGPCSFQELYRSDDFLVLPYQSDFIRSAWHSSTGNASYDAARRGIEALTATVKSTFSENRLDAIIYPEQRNLVVKLGSPSQAGRNGILAALTGHPVVTIPAGFSNPSVDAPIGIPIGMEILGLPFSESKLLQIAWQITSKQPVRQSPAFAEGFVEVSAYSVVPIIHPNRHNILPAYPIGILS